MTFLRDISQLLKTFQKSLESDTNSILEVKDKKQDLFKRLKNCVNQSLENGWEELFSSQIEDRNTDGFFSWAQINNNGKNKKCWQ